MIPDIPEKTLEAMEREEYRIKQLAEEKTLANLSGEDAQGRLLRGEADNDIYEDEVDPTDAAWMSY